MNHLVLGCEIEYKQAAKRLEELFHAQPGTPQSLERKELIRLFVQFEKHIRKKEQR